MEFNHLRGNFVEGKSISDKNKMIFISPKWMNPFLKAVIFFNIFE